MKHQPVIVRPPGLNVAGYFRAELGIGEAARQVVNAVDRAGIPFATVTYRDWTASRQRHARGPQRAHSPVYDTNLICVNADGVPAFAANVGHEFFAGRYSIGLWWWELSAFPPSMRQGLAYVDEVWAGSDYTRAAIATATEKPVLKFPMPVALSTPKPRSRLELALPGGFVFLFTFDFFSVLERKNPLGLIEAFERAFEPGEGPTLVIKSINGDSCRDHLGRVEAAARSDVVVVDRYRSADDMNALLASCDCYVSLHRSEGFGLPLAQAMAYGKPVIATGYSGNLEFMDSENSYLVPHRSALVPAGCDPYPAGAEWAEPDLDAAAGMMRHVWENRDEAARRGARGRETILRRHDPSVAGKFIRDRLDEIRSSRPTTLAGDALVLGPRPSRLRRGAAAIVRRAQRWRP